MATPSSGPGSPAAALTARQLAELHRQAQERIGLAGAIIGYEAFSSGVNVLTPTTDGAWLAHVLSATKLIAKLSRRLAGRYYALTRAIQTGYTVPDIDGQSRGGKRIPIGDLYKQMPEVHEEVVDFDPGPKPGPSVRDTPSVDTVGTPQGEAPATPKERYEYVEKAKAEIQKAFDRITPAETSRDYTRNVAVDEDWDWPVELDDTDELQNLIDAEIAALKAEVAKQTKSDKTMAKAMDAIREEADKAAARSGSLADAAGINSGRSVVERSGSKDRRRIAWMRVTGSNPCAFCAMLASRGAAYQTEAAATYGPGGSLYHTNCHCTAIAVFVDNPYYSELDLFFIKNWPLVTKGYSSKDSLVAWRRWLHRQYLEGNVPEQDNKFLQKNKPTRKLRAA